MSASITISLDASHFALPNPTGVERYTAALLPLLTKRLQESGATVQWIGIPAGPPLDMPANALWKSLPYRPFWGQVAVSRFLRSEKPVLYFTPSGIPPLRGATRTALTIHDLAAYEEPAAFGAGELVRLRLMSRQVARQASAIIVPSRYVGDQISKYWKLDTTHVSIIPEGYQEMVTTEEIVTGLDNAPFFLYVGRLERKKNLEPVLQGFGRLASERPCRLVLAGTPGHGYAQIQKQLSKFEPKVRSRIVLPGYVSDAQKAWLYSHAAAGIIPCPYEGFGLPVLDCFAAKTVAICAHAGALPEVGGDACIYAEASSKTDWYLQMLSVLENSASRAEYIRKGSEYVRKYTWQAAANHTAQILLAATD